MLAYPAASSGSKLDVTAVPERRQCPNVRDRTRGTRPARFTTVSTVRVSKPDLLHRSSPPRAETTEGRLRPSVFPAASRVRMSWRQDASQISPAYRPLASHGQRSCRCLRGGADRRGSAAVGGRLTAGSNLVIEERRRKHQDAAAHEQAELLRATRLVLAELFEITQTIRRLARSRDARGASVRCPHQLGRSGRQPRQRRFARSAVT